MHRSRPLLTPTLALLACMAAAGSVAGAAEAKAIDVEIVSQPLAAALQELAKQSGVQIIFFSKIADGYSAPSVEGRVTLDAALHRLLSGTKLTYRRLNPTTIEIRRLPDLGDAHGAGAKLRVASGAPAATAMATGDMTASAGDPPPPTGPADPLQAGGGAPDLAGVAAGSAGAGGLQTVVVTGTRAGNRTVATSLAPIDVLTPTDLANTGAPDLAMALRTLLPSFNFPQPSVTDATDASQPAQLRGLSPDETLVLIDGKRQHSTAIVNVNGSLGRGSSPVDLNAIPIDAIDHIEVLRDGAAAQYGSDAIAGVINIILKHGAKGGSASVMGGRYSRGDGATWQAGADDGVALGSKGWLRVSADGTHQNPTDRAGPDTRYPADPTYRKVTFHYGLPALQSEQGSVNLQYDFTPDVQLYAFSLLNHRDVWAGGFFRSLSQFKTSTPAATAVYPDGYLPIEESTLRDDTEVAGLRGTAAGWRYDLSADTGGNQWRLNTANTFNYSLGAGSPTDFYVGTLKYRQTLVNADFKRGFQPGWLRNGLLVAWGLEYRHENFNIDAGDSASYAGSGAQVYPGYTPQDAGSHTRNSQAVYLDLESDLTDKLSTEVAVRHEHYGDFGSTTSEELSGRYAFTPVIAMRATASTGFRAPSLQQEYYSSTAINFINSVPYTIRTFPVTAGPAVALGAQPLKPELAHNYTVGLVLTPHDGLYTTLDAYQITIAHRIILSGNLIGTPVQNYLTSAGYPFVTGGRFFTNAVDTRTRGVDLVSSYSMPFEASSLAVTGGMNYNKTDILSIAPNPPQVGLAGLTLPIITRDEQGRIAEGTPRTKVFAAADWRISAWTVHGQITRYGEWTDRSLTTPANDQTYGAIVVLDANVGYQWRAWSFSLGADDLNDAYPDRVKPANSVGGILPYPQTSPIGFSGAYYYGTAAYRW
jgi:iron complex outermembrane recepter protein